MLFNSVSFIFYFLPFLLILVSLSKGIHSSNLILVIASVIYYFWMDAAYLPVLIIVVLFNFLGVRLFSSVSSTRRYASLFLIILFNIAILVLFKYTLFLLNFIDFIFGSNFSNILKSDSKMLSYFGALPLGISFYIFHAISYVVDVYKGISKRNDNFIQVLLYFTFFPQLIAGPLIRYHNIDRYLHRRTIKLKNIEFGLTIFIVGLAKKVLIADNLAIVADTGFQNINALTQIDAFVVLLAYSCQIYFDFSGYSDMAIGLARIFGFKFPMNFNLPYSATSLRDFWTRWHISLSTWIKDYLYIPLGGSHHGIGRTALNLFIVFSLCGLWHGASLNFLVWGLIHGMFIYIERLTNYNGTRFIGNIYTLTVVFTSWIFFKAESLPLSIDFIYHLVYPVVASEDNIYLHDDYKFYCTLIVAIYTSIFSSSFKECIYPLLKFHIIKNLILLILLVFSIASIVVDSYSPFLYYKF